MGIVMPGDRSRTQLRERVENKEKILPSRLPEREMVPGRSKRRHEAGQT